jgi:hypothetical protein
VARTDEGVQFPLAGSERSSLALGQAVFADSVRHYDPNLANRIEASENWRGDYVEFANELTQTGIRSGDTAVGIARNGLKSLHERMTFIRGDIETSVEDMVASEVDPAFESVQVLGDGERTTTMDVRYGGKALMGDDIHTQLDAWVEKGIAEEGFRDAISAVVGNPDWYDLRDTTIVLLGAGAEMSPVRQLLSWGATVIAVDLPGSSRWKKLLEDARARSGRLIVPAATGRLGDSPADNETAGAAGADMVVRTPEVRQWLRDTMPQGATVSSLAYAEGATHVRVSVASDAIIAGLQQDGLAPALSFLATPTDAWAVPADVVAASQERWDRRGAVGTLQLPLRVTAGMFAPNYSRTWPSDRNLQMGICDAVVPQQGPNYLLAKRMQHWRAVVARDEANTVSFNIMAATRTNSVVKNRLLSAAYAGASRFGLEVFSPDTSRTLAAALLVHDLRNPKSAAKPSVRLQHPYAQFQRTANHGGLWRMAYSPRSVLGTAAVLGLFKSGS